MSFWKRGKPSTVVVDEITEEGFRLQVDHETFWVSFEDYPMFRGVDEQVLRHGFEVLPHSGIWWPDLDEGIEFEALRHPERYPLLMWAPEKRRAATK